MGASPVWWDVLLVVRSGGPSSKGTGSRDAVVFDSAQMRCAGVSGGVPGGAPAHGRAPDSSSPAPPRVWCWFSDRCGLLLPVPDVPEDARLAAEVLDALQVRTGGEEPRALEQREAVGLVE